jgi:ABC-type polysaccharide/polyol phosphate export permease
VFSGRNGFLLRELVLRDFRIRYRNMSLGVFWSLLNPLVMMAVLWFVFTRVFPVRQAESYHLVVLCGLVPFNFFSLGWSTGTVSLLANSNLIKRVPIEREIVPVSTVLANGMHFLIQIGLLLGLVLASGRMPNLMWGWLPVVFGLEVALVCGLSLMTSALDVYFRDVRYVVESSTMLLFWLVPIFYDHGAVPAQWHWVYWYNPIAAVVLCCRNILLEGRVEAETLVKLAVLSLGTLGMGFGFFRLVKSRFADYM